MLFLRFVQDNGLKNGRSVYLGSVPDAIKSYSDKESSGAQMAGTDGDENVTLHETWVLPGIRWNHDTGAVKK